eukprot:2881466-Heterocapsa_arctica.AAC.1
MVQREACSPWEGHCSITSRTLWVGRLPYVPALTSRLRRHRPAHKCTPGEAHTCKRDTGEGTAKESGP